MALKSLLVARPDVKKASNDLQAAVTKAVAREVVEAALDVACQSNDDLRVKEHMACQPHIQAWAPFSCPFGLQLPGFKSRALLLLTRPRIALHARLLTIAKQSDRTCIIF